MKHRTLISVRVGVAALAVALTVAATSAQAQTSTAGTLTSTTTNSTTIGSGTTSAATTWAGYTPQGGFWLTGVGDLTVGSRSQAVADLQGFLIEGGYLVLDPSVPRGYFGEITRDALIHYQLSRGLPVTGILDVGTRNSLAQSITQRMNPTGVAPNTGTSNGYWYNGIWYTYPYGLTSSTSNASTEGGYWYNGVWYSTSNSTTTTGVTGTDSTDTSTTTARRVTGFVSGDPMSDGFNGATASSGYWYNGAWYSYPTTSASSMTGNSSTGTNSSSNGYWYNGVWYSNSASNTSNGTNGGNGSNI